tara:strand:+ start:2121 stop:2390 length:270 start_codon:yes stop_codon:yes gene_type:complete
MTDNTKIYEAGKVAGERWLADPERQKYDNIPTNKWESWFAYADTIPERTLERGHYPDMNPGEHTGDELKQEYDRGFDEAVESLKEEEDE